MAEAFYAKAKDRSLKKKQSEVTFRRGGSASQVKTGDSSPQDIIIALIGPTGSGKSSFINTITGNLLETGAVGHDLESCTSEIRTVRFSVPEVAYGDLVFVDTPGFDDKKKSDVDILKMIAEWLKSTYETGTLLSGLLYFHQITDNRMAGTPSKNLRKFEGLCGKNAIQNVVLVTTMWDMIDEEEGEARERRLKSKCWRGMLERHSTTSRFLWTRKSAFTSIDPLINTANRRISVLLQQEMVDMKRQLPATSAALELYLMMEVLMRQRQELLDRIRNEIKRADGDMALEPLQKEHEKLRINLEKTFNKMRELELPFGKGLIKTAEKLFGNKFTSTFFNVMLSSDPSPDDIIIAVIGPSGSGKSTFINTITGLETSVGHTLDSCTREVRGFGRFIPDLAYDNLVFVDTPGFDDKKKSDVDILKMVAEWLESKYGKFGKKVLLSGVLYFHRITDNRASTRLHMFEELCGQLEVDFHNVIFTTTMWDEIKEEGADRELELKLKYWRPMLEHGSTTSRFLGSRESAFALVKPFIESAGLNKRVSVPVQQNTVDMSRQLPPATSAGDELYSKIEFLARQRQELLDRIRNEMKRAEGDQTALEPLQQEHEKLQNNMEVTVNKMRELKLPLRKRLVKMTEKFFGVKSMSFEQSKDQLTGDDDSAADAENFQIAPSHQSRPDSIHLH